MTDTDVVVVGAGPAGSAAALVLARAGVRVTILDAHAFPRDKICGDLLGTEAVAALGRLGVRDVLANATPVAGATLYGPRGRATGAHAVTAACVLPRYELDARLLAVARAAGASVVRARVTGLLRAADDATVVGVTTDGGDVRARATIGADGYGSVVARAIGVGRPATRDVAVTVRAYARGVAPLAGRMRFYVNRTGDGYGWIFPIGHDRANVGLGFVRGEPGAGDPHAAFRRFVSGTGPAAACLTGATFETAVAWPIPLGGRTRPLAVAGAYLAGDAASLASPLSGSGIANALASGTLAAAAVERALAPGDYARVVATSLGRRLRVEAYAHRACGTAARIEPWLALARAVPGGERALARALLALG